MELSDSRSFEGVNWRVGKGAVATGGSDGDLKRVAECPSGLVSGLAKAMEERMRAKCVPCPCKSWCEEWMQLHFAEGVAVLLLIVCVLHVWTRVLG